jgi:protein TonB
LTATAAFLAPATGLLPERRRTLVLVAVVLLHLLAILALLWLRLEVPRGKKGPGSMVAVNIAAPTPERAQPKPQPQVRPKTERSAPQPEPIVTAPDAPPAKWSFGDPALLGFDLRKLPRAESAPAQMAQAGPPDSAVVGVAPDGSKLYAAEWQREPTDAELAFYLKSARYAGPGAYGLIACRTAPRFKVEDCKAIGESPGSGLGYAVQEAAWQFRVKPPRVDGEYQVGTWVSIRIDIRPAN